ncbi:MAG TPA: aminotransferase class IV [Vicinamibacteria bacterium]|nr:aminotransferase class IV [Vicinamibacteria bacterium]
MTETFALGDGVAARRGDASDLAAASADLPAGAYTTLRTYGGDGVAFLDDHARRLVESVAAQGHPAPLDGDRLREGLAAVLRATGHPESKIRLTFAPPDLFASIDRFDPLPERLYQDGVWCVAVPVRRDVPHAKDTRFVAAARGAYEALPDGAHEGLLLAEDGVVLEGLSSNFFAVLDGVLRTEDSRALRGTTRATVLELARGLVPVSLEGVTRAELGRATEAFLTSVSREVLSVVKVDDVAIARGRPGPLARELRRRYRARAAAAAEHLLGP